MNREAVAIIPARGGSKRLPRKNILEILGRPMLAYPVGAALESGLFSQVIVSTEDEEIARVGESFGARIVERPEALAEDRATVVQVCLHTLSVLQQEQCSFDRFCCIYPTAVFITASDLSASVRMLDEEPAADVVMGVSEYNLPPVQALEAKGGFLRPKWPEYVRLQSQFHPKLVADTGTIYWARAEAFATEMTFYARKLKGFSIPRKRAVDIDTPEDLDVARTLATLLLTDRGE
jgi:N-acylneuraminate cytidylyltransferase